MKHFLLLLIPFAMSACSLLLVAAVVLYRTETDRSVHGAQVPDLGSEA